MNNSGRFLFIACFAVIASITSQLAKRCCNLCLLCSDMVDGKKVW